MPVNRKPRLQERLREELSEVIRRDMRDSRFKEGLLSITDVQVTGDYKIATVFVSVLGDEHVRRDILNALRGAAGVLRGELGRRKSFNSVPELHFRYDETLEKGAQMFELLERVRREDAERAAATEAPQPEQSEAE